MVNRLLAGASVLALGCYYTPAMADSLTISAAQTTPVRTSAAGNGTPGDITIASGGSITPTGGTAVTIDSSNSVNNQGAITINGADNSAGIVANAGVTGNITSSGTITVSESYTRTDTNSDAVLDGPYAQGNNRFGIRTLGALNGNITTSGTISVQANNSAGISLGGQLNGSLSSTGTVNVTGDNGVGIRTGVVTGNVVIGGTVSALGTNSSGVILGDNIGGSLTVTSTVVSSGYSSITLPASTTSLTASNLNLGGPAFWVQGDLAGGANFAAPTSTTTNGTTTTTPGASINSYGSSPALLIGSASRAVNVGAFAGDANGYGLVIGGSITGSGVYSGFNATGAQIGGLGGAVTVANGIRVTGTIGGVANGANATGLRLGSGASAPTLNNAGTIAGRISAIGTATNPLAVGLLIDTGATLPSITNLGTIGATGVTNASAAGIIDRSGTLAQINNAGVIQATGGTSNVAIDVSASTAGVAINQASATGGFANPAITGDIRFGGGQNSLTASIGTVSGNVSFGAASSGNVFALSGNAVYAGDVNFAGSSGTLTIGSGSSFTGGIFNGSAVGVTVNGGTYAINTTTASRIGSLAFNGGTLKLAVNSANPASALLQVAGNASFGANSVLQVQFQHLNDAVGTFALVQAGSLSGVGNLTLSANSVPFLFNRSLATDTGNTTLSLVTTRKTATQLGLTPTLATVYDPAYTAALADQPIGDTFVSFTDQAGVNKALRQMLPNFSGGVFDSVSLATRSAEKVFADRNLLPIEPGHLASWVQLAGWTDKKSIGATAGYSNYGGGLTGGVERNFGTLGRIGASVSYLVGVINDVGTTAGINQNELLFNLYWRASWGRFHAYATGGIGKVDFDSSRYFDGTSGGTAFTRTATGKWGSTLYTGSAGASYEVPAGRFYLRPEASIDYVRLKENSYAETGGGAGFNLLVNGRTSSETAVNGKVALGYYISKPNPDGGNYSRIEIEGGDRAQLSSSLGSTTAHFANGSNFTLIPEDRKAGWTGGVRISAGNDIFVVTAEATAERQQSHTAGLARVGVTFKL